MFRAGFCIKNTFTGYMKEVNSEISKKVLNGNATEVLGNRCLFGLASGTVMLWPSCEIRKSKCLATSSGSRIYAFYSIRWRRADV